MIVDFEEDIVWFIDRHFSRNDLGSVYDLLDAEPFQTPRVVRAVLFLSNGSLSLLRHYARSCSIDVGGVLMHAEYVAGVSEMPMQVRDMTLPFWHERNREPGLSRSSSGRPPASTGANAARSAGHHAHLLDRRFRLGRINYRISTKQPNAGRVRCFRTERSAVTLVELPLAFVLEQLAERIEITDAAY